MSRALTTAARDELVQAVRERYRAGSREAKKLILGEFAAVSGYHRKSAIRVLNGTPCDRVCGKRLKALFAVLFPALERNDHLQLDEGIRARLMAMSAATIDRLLREVRSVSGRSRVRMTPTALRKSVPIRTFADLHEPVPGFKEMDLVAHCGDVAAGGFIHTLTVTDIASGWTECLPLLVTNLHGRSLAQAEE